MPDAPVEITVAVPVKDRREQMQRCLRALLDQDHASYEVLVLDNESSDGTPEACRELANGSEVAVRVEVVSGTVGAVRNRAGEVGRGEFLAFTDSDCLPDPGWLRAITEAFRADPGLGVICGRTKPEGPILEGWPQTQDIERFSGWFEACNLAFRADAFRQGGGFDDKIGLHCEDTVAGYATMRSGWRATFVPDALVLHDVTYPGFAYHLRRAGWMRNLGPVLRQYPEIANGALWGGVFARPRDAQFVAAATGLALAVSRRRPEPLLLAIPYARSRLWSLHDPKVLAQNVLHDTAFVLACAQAGVTARRLVL